MSTLANDADNEELGGRLLTIRSNLELSQIAFAASLGVSARAYQNYERGEREVPAAVLRSLYLVHQVEPVWVLTGEDPGARASSPSSLDLEALEVILEEVESRLKRLPRRPDVRRTAALIRILYEHLVEDQQLDARFVERAMRLVA